MTPADPIAPTYHAVELSSDYVLPVYVRVSFSFDSPAYQFGTYLISSQWWAGGQGIYLLLTLTLLLIRLLDFPLANSIS